MAAVDGPTRVQSQRTTGAAASPSQRECEAQVPLSLDGLTAKEALRIVDLICSLFAHPSRPGGLSEVDRRELKTLPKMHLTAIKMAPLNRHQSGLVLATAIFCAKPVKVPVVDKSDPCPAGYDILDLVLKSRDQLEIVEFGYR